MKVNYADGFPKQLNLAVTCASGLEKTVKSEFRRLGYGEPPAENGAFSLSADINAVARLNLNLRTADRVYIVIGKFSALSFDQLFDGVKNLPFEEYITKDGNITVNGKCVKSKLFSISDCQKIIKKAIVTRLSEKFKVNRLAETGATYGVEFSIFKDCATIMLNTSGVGLHKRGYRDMVGIAPIRETLASALLLMSDFYWERPFLDAFCGSGTIAIEGAKTALNIAAGINRTFDFNRWTNFDKRVFDLAVEECKDNEKRDRKLQFFASDIDPKAIKLATRHAESAGVKGYINFSVKDVGKVKLDLPFGTIVTNPPYGERVFDKAEAEDCYKKLRTLMDLNPAWSLFLITSAKNFQKVFGKKCDREKKLFNSNKECRYYFYYGTSGK